MGNSLIEMYARCWSMKDAWRFVQRGAITGCGLLNGRCAMHGHGEEALEHLNGCVKVYTQMISLFFFCQLVAMQGWWMNACAIFNDHGLYDFCKIGNITLAWSTFLVVLATYRRQRI